MDESKRKVIVDSVKKLIALKVSDKEIILNLKDIGVSEREAREIIAEAKGKPSLKKKKETKGDSGKILREVAETLASEAPKPAPPEKPASAEEIAEDVAVEDPKLKELVKEVKKPLPKTLLKPVEKKVASKKPEKQELNEKTKFSVEEALKKAEKSRDSHINLNKLWEKGIIVTVEHKLEEMKKLQKEIEKKIDEKVEKATEKKMHQMKVLFDSQKDLLLGKIDARLEQSEEDSARLFEEKLKEIKLLNESVKKSLELLGGKKEEFKSAVDELDSKLSDLNETKKEMISETNSELITMKSQMQEFLDSAKERMSEIDSRVSKTLELETKIAEGLIQDAEDKLNEIASEKGLELSKKVNASLANLEELEKKLDPEKIQSQLQKMQELESTLEDTLQEKMAEIDDRFEKKLLDIEAKWLEAMKKKIAGEINVKDFKDLMQELNDFKQQFIQMVQLNIGKINKAIRSLNEKTKYAEKQVNKRVELIDKKIAELDAFEKTFAAEMGLALDKATENSSKQKKKKK